MNNPPSLKTIPKHVAIIMDGNGRWAQKKGLPRVFGHEEGVKRVREIVQASVKFGIKILTLYSFSTENWKRPPKEVDFLLTLFKHAFEGEIKDFLKKQGIRAKVIGRRDEKIKSILKEIELFENETKKGKILDLNIALNYGGRKEIVDSFKNILEKGICDPSLINEKIVNDNLYLSNVIDPDILIRTGGEMRLSNFLLWEMAYTELYFTKVLWPDFKEKELKKALKNFAKRERKFGRVRIDAKI